MDASTQTAYDHVLNAPDLTNYAGIDGYIKNWNRTFAKARKSRTQPKMFSANFGYAVESLATKVYMPDDPGGYTAFLQVAEPGTRPDVELVKNNVAVAWIDLTASESKNHIDFKKGDWANIPHVSEITYPSITPESFQMMLANEEVTEPEDADPERMLFLKAAADELRKMRFTRILHLQNRFRDISKLRLRKSKQVDPEELCENLLYKAPMLNALNRFFNLGLDVPVYTENVIETDDQYKKVCPENVTALEVQAPHILAALGIDPTLHLFVGGGDITGKNWLYRYDPKMPQMADAIKKLTDIPDVDEVIKEEPKEGESRKNMRDESKKKKEPKHRKKRKIIE